MTTKHIDLVNGNDSNDGSSWGLAWKTVTNGATAARIAPGDLIKISKTPEPVSLGNGKWFANNEATGGFPAVKNIVSSTNASPIVMTVTNHGYSNGDILRVDAHTSNAASNGIWEIANVTTNTFELVNSVGSGTGTGNGSVQLINSGCILLTTAQTKNIDLCQLAWTAANTSTVTADGGGYYSLNGYYSSKTVFPASPATSTKYAYKALAASMDFSAYQKISLTIGVSAQVSVNKLKICLCSDTTGDVIVDTFKPIQLEATTSIIHLTIAKDGGGNLGNAIQSIALYSDTSAPPASLNVYLCNIMACTTSGLSLCDLISKNSAAKDGTGDWYAISGINEKVIYIGSGVQNVVNSQAIGRGYIETAETVTTYKRETFATTMASATSTVASAVMDEGTLSSYIEFSGGWNTSSNTQDGETFLDGRNYYGYGFQLYGRSFVKVSYINCYRYYRGLYLDTGAQSHGIYIFNCRYGHNSTYDIYMNQNIHSSLFENIRMVSSVQGCAFSNQNMNLTFNSLYIANTRSYQFTPGCNCKVYNSSFFNGYYYGINSANSLLLDFYNCTIKKMGSASVNAAQGTLIRLWNCTLEDATEYFNGNVSGSRYVMYSHNHDKTANNHWIFINTGSTINSQAASMTNAAGSIEWKMTVGTASNYTFNPLILNVGRIAVGASTQVTATIYVKKAHATNVGCRLVCKGGQIAGVNSDVIATAADNTNEQQLSISFTPTEAGVVQLQVEGYYVAGNSTILVDNLAVTQS